MIALHAAFIGGCGATADSAHPVPGETTTSEGLTIDRTKVSPVTSMVQRITWAEGARAEFDISEAIRLPADSPRVYVSWWLGFDPTSPSFTSRKVSPSDVTFFDVVPCDQTYNEELETEDGKPVTMLVEALVSTSDSVAIDDSRTEPRFAPDGSEILFVQWTLVVEGESTECGSPSAANGGL